MSRGLWVVRKRAVEGPPLAYRNALTPPLLLRSQADDSRKPLLHCRPENNSFAWRNGVPNCAMAALGQNLPFRPPVGNGWNGAESRHGDGRAGCPLLANRRHWQIRVCACQRRTSEHATVTPTDTANRLESYQVQFAPHDLRSARRRTAREVLPPTSKLVQSSRLERP